MGSVQESYERTFWYIEAKIGAVREVKVLDHEPEKWEIDNVIESMLNNAARRFCDISSVEVVVKPVKVRVTIIKR